MSSKYAKSLEDLDQACSRAETKWSQYHYVMDAWKETPSQHFARVGSLDNFKHQYEEATKQNNRLIPKLAPIGGTIFAGIVVMSPYIVAVAPFALYATYNKFKKSKKIASELRSDFDTAQEAFPEFEKDLNKILNFAKQIIRDANASYTTGNIEKQERDEALVAVYERLTRFTEDNLSIGALEMESNEHRIPGSNNDKRIIEKIKSVIGEVLRVSATAQLPSVGQSEGIGMSQNRVFDQDQQPDIGR